MKRNCKKDFRKNSHREVLQNDPDHSKLRGDVGKTTLCFHFAYLFAETGKNVLLVDIDPQGNLTSCYLRAPSEKIHHIKLIFEKELPVPLRVRERIHLLTSDIELSKHELQVKLETYFRLKTYLSRSEIKNSYDVILIDTPPALNIFTSNALIASDCVLCVADPGKFVIMGYTEIKNVTNDIVDKINASLKMTGIVLNIVNPRTVNLRHLYEKCREKFGSEVFLKYVRYSTVIRNALTEKLTVSEYAPLHSICHDFRKVFTEFVKKRHNLVYLE